MTQFLYRSVLPSGKKQSGLIEAGSLSEARRLVHERGEILLDLRESAEKQRFKLERQTGLSLRVTAQFAGELAPLLKAGAPLRKALEIMAEGDGKTARMARSYADGIDRGERLSQLILNNSGQAVLLGRFIEAGEKGAGLAIMADKAANFLNARADSTEKIRGALAYPVFVLLLAVMAMLVIVLFVAPALAPALSETDGASLIKTMAAFGNWVTTNSTIIMLVLAASIAGFYLFRNTLGLSERLARIMDRAPWIGPIRKDLSAGPAADVLGALIEAGTPVADALDTAASLAAYPSKQAFSESAERIRDGTTVGEALSTANALPSEISRLALLGEQTGGLGQSLSEAGRLCQARALQKISRAAAVAGPALVVIIGGLVAAMMLLVLSGLTSIGEGAL